MDLSSVSKGKMQIAELLECRAKARAELQKCDDARATALRQELRRIKARLFYLRHRGDPVWKRRAYCTRRLAKLQAYQRRLSAFPDDQFVNQTRTAGYMKRVIAEKLQHVKNTVQIKRE